MQPLISRMWFSMRKKATPAEFRKFAAENEEKCKQVEETLKAHYDRKHTEEKSKLIKDYDATFKQLQDKYKEKIDDRDLIIMNIKQSLEVEHAKKTEELKKEFEVKMQLFQKESEMKKEEEFNEIKAKLSSMVPKDSTEKEFAIKLAEVKAEFEKSKTAEIKLQVEAAKRKEWCANCLKEACFRCCWNTSYCGKDCQVEHWPKHMAICENVKEATALEKDVSAVRDETSSPQLHIINTNIGASGPLICPSNMNSNQTAQRYMVSKGQIISSIQPCQFRGPIKAPMIITSVSNINGTTAKK